MRNNTILIITTSILLSLLIIATIIDKLSWLLAFALLLFFDYILKYFAKAKIEIRLIFYLLIIFMSNHDFFRIWPRTSLYSVLPS